MLGITESAGEFSNLFTLADRKNNIYTKKLIPTPLNFTFATSNYHVTKIAADKSMSRKTWDIADSNKQADQILLNRYAPVGVMINDNMDILQFRGETSPYQRARSARPGRALVQSANSTLPNYRKSKQYQNLYNVVIDDATGGLRPAHSLISPT